MGVAIKVSDYLHSLGVQYQLVPHQYSQSALQSAVKAGVPARQTAKAILLEDHEGRRVMAVVPAANRLLLDKLGELLKRELHLLPERKLRNAFDDCELGAVPALGDPYQVQAVYDDQLSEQNEIYLEAGDHENLICLNREAFMALMANHEHGHFSVVRGIDYGQSRRLWDWQ